MKEITKPVIEIIASKRTGDWHEKIKALLRITINEKTGLARYEAGMTPGQFTNEFVSCDSPISKDDNDWLRNESPVVMGFPTIPKGETGDQSVLKWSIF